MDENQNSKTNQIKTFFEATPKNVDRAIAISLTLLSLAVVILLIRSSSVQIDKNGVTIQRQLARTTTERDQAITVAKVCETGLDQLEDQTEDFARNHPEGQVLVNEVEEVKHLVEVSKPSVLGH